MTGKYFKQCTEPITGSINHKTEHK